MQSTFPGADIGRSSSLWAMPYRVMVAHFPVRKNETFGRRCQRSLFFPILEIGRRFITELEEEMIWNFYGKVFCRLPGSRQ